MTKKNHMFISINVQHDSLIQGKHYGIRKAGNLEIIDGLNENDRVVKEGLARLVDGMTVKPLMQ